MLGYLSPPYEGYEYKWKRRFWSINAKQQAQLAHPAVPIEICAAVDETFFDQVVLVMLDSSTGFILVDAVFSRVRHLIHGKFGQLFTDNFGRYKSINSDCE